uniref:Uncharacterized protein n=1 Tax=Chromera velia CCMP2878 TaxID=1169474 RepID=A0A0G4I8S8_9ALVE|eukprot:Cvel_12049.t1-p1 / transcript=Cvel_12049.t1 / gene=Cvel_12049 / organism=Chromera_velia_CCMP2878 / gene_product=hypothetical protein / transcript_product=hypothetical protein / location=Cvel_scaffold774:39431-40348(-) / protein_length=234 / sequence_SO=supercontig / SO=protein_coding / is_pseudo=false
MSTIKSKSSWKPRPNPKKPNKKLGQPKTTLVFNSDDNAEKCNKLFGEWFYIETKDGRLFFYRIPKNEQQKKQSRVRWARGILASPDAHDEEEVKEAKEVVAKEGDEDGSRPAVNPAPHTADAPPGLQGTLNGGVGSEQAGMVPVGGGEERQETAVESGPLVSSFADIDQSHQTPPTSPARRGQIRQRDDAPVLSAPPARRQGKLERGDESDGEMFKEPDSLREEEGDGPPGPRA